MNNKLSQCLLVVFFLNEIFWSTAAASEEPTVLSFQGALSLAEERNPSAIAASERVKQALERLNQARAAVIPHVDASFSENRQTINLDTLGIGSVLSSAPGGASIPSVTPAFNSFDARLKVAGQLFDVSLIKRLEAAAAGKNMSFEDARKVKQDAMALVGTLYIQALRSQESLDLSEKVVRLNIWRHRIAKTRLQAGNGSQSELESAAADLGLARYRWRTTFADAATARDDLKAALGLPQEQAVVFADKTPLLNISLVSPERVKQELTKHPEVLSAEAQVHARAAEEEAAWAELAPKISGTANYGFSGQSPSNTNDTYFLGAELSMPVFDAGDRLAKAIEAKSRVEEAKVTLKDAKDVAENKASAARDAFKTAVRLVQAKHLKLLQMDRQINIVRARMQNGSSSSLDFIQTETDLALSADDYEEAIALYRTAQINLAHALGVLDSYNNQKAVSNEK